MRESATSRVLRGVGAMVVLVLVGCTPGVLEVGSALPETSGTTVLVITTTTVNDTTSAAPPRSASPIVIDIPGPNDGTTTTTSTTTTTTVIMTTTTVPTTTTTRRTTTTTAAPSTTTTLHPDGIRGLLTTTGVPVLLKATDGTRWMVSSPCGRDVWLSGGTPIYQTDVIIDPGHGGNRDIGATGPNGLQEKVVNLRIGREAERLLKQRGIDVIMTRTGDYASTLSTRARLADGLGAEIMVSIHHNAPTPPPSSKPGNEVYIQSDSEKSRRLGGLLYKYSMAALGQFDIQWSSTAGAGVMTVRHPDGHDVYGIIRNPKTPTALLEFGRLSHSPEAVLFATDAYVQAAARSIADAVDAYLNTSEAGSGYVAGRVRTANPGLSQADCVDPNLGDNPGVCPPTCGGTARRRRARGA